MSKSWPQPADKVVCASVMLRADKFPTTNPKEIDRLFREWIMQADELNSVIAVTPAKVSTFSEATQP